MEAKGKKNQDNIDSVNQSEYFSVREFLQHFFLMMILWGLLYFESEFIQEILDRWSNPFYTSNLFSTGGRLAEMIALALSIVMAVYTIGITLFFLARIITRRFKNINYNRLIHLNIIVLTSFVVYWVLFLSIFVRL